MRVLHRQHLEAATETVILALRGVPVSQRLSLAEIACGLIMEEVRASLPAPEHPVEREMADLFAELPT